MNKCVYLIPIIFLFIKHAECQEADLTKKISLDTRGKTVQQVLAELEASYQLSFSYSPEIVPLDLKPEEAYINTRLEEVLTDYFENFNIQFRLVGKQIVLYEKKETRKYILSGYVVDSVNGEALIGVTIYVPTYKSGCLTDVYGYYNIQLTEGDHEIIYTYVGFNSQKHHIDLKSNQRTDIKLQASSQHIDEVIITSREKVNLLTRTRMSYESLNIQAARKVPNLFGENDVIRSLNILPGVSSNELSSDNVYVRGGSSDQTIFLMDEVLLTDVAHFGGFFSIFNPDIVKNVHIYKCDIPAHQPGALSSIIDVRLKDGNKNHWQTSGGIGTIAARVTVEGPLIKNKASMIISARRTYLDQILKILLKNPQGLDFNFHDLNLKFNTTLSDKDQLYLSSYYGHDLFYQESSVFRNNYNLAVRWNHIYNEKWRQQTKAYFATSRFGQIVNEGVYNFKWLSRYRQYRLQTEAINFTNDNFTSHAGYIFNFNRNDPASLSPYNELSIFMNASAERERAVEQAVYYSVKAELGTKFAIDAGIRLVHFMQLGPESVYNYADRPENSPVVDTSRYSEGEIVYSAFASEPQMHFRYMLTPSSSLKAGYSRNVQFMHMLKKYEAGLTITSWMMPGKYFPNEISNNITLGYFYQNRKKNLEASAEAFYRYMRNMIENTLIVGDYLNDNFEASSKITDGQAMGVELSIGLDLDRLQLSGNYTLAYVERQSPYLNNQKPYNPFYDHRHTINIYGVIDLSKRTSFSFNWTFHTGQPYSLINGKYSFEGNPVVQYDEKRLFTERLPDYHRLDLNIEIAGKKNHQRRWKGYWVFTVYNVYMQKNPLGIVYYDMDQDNTELKPSYVYFYQFVPSVAYNFRF